MWSCASLSFSAGPPIESPSPPALFSWGRRACPERAKRVEGCRRRMRGRFTSTSFARLRGSRTSVGKSRISGKAPPSSGFATFSPRKKPRGEKGSRRRELQCPRGNNSYLDLRGDEFLVAAAAIHQLVVGPTLDHHALIHHQNQVGRAHGA